VGIYKGFYQKVFKHIIGYLYGDIMKAIIRDAIQHLKQEQNSRIVTETEQLLKKKYPDRFFEDGFFF